MADSQVIGRNRGKRKASANDRESLVAMREEFETSTGMSDALSRVRAHFERTGDLPHTVYSCLCQGPEEALSRLSTKMANIALVAALFIVGSIDALVNPPAVFDEEGVHPLVQIVFTLMMAAAIGAFGCLIIFFTLMANHFPKLMHHDADILLFLLETNFDSALMKYMSIPIVVGIACSLLGVYVSLNAVYPWFVVIPATLVLIAPSLHVAILDKNFGYSPLRGGLWTFYRPAAVLRKQRIDFLLSTVYAPLVEYDKEVLPLPVDEARTIEAALVARSSPKRQSHRTTTTG